MKKYHIKTLGCKTNQIESNLIAEQLSAHGYTEEKIAQNADIFILNSCSVTSNADNEAMKIIKKIKKSNPQIITILTGCFAQLEANALENIGEIDIVLGNTEKMFITDYIEKRKKINVNNIFEQTEFIYKKVENPTKTRAYLKIQDGCNNRCSYCTIWKARGNSRSCKAEDILNQIETYVHQGFEEIVLTGIHIGQWGGDLNQKMTFIDLIKAIENSNIKRYRLGSLDPSELSDELINFLANSKKFCPHFHMSLQSACNKTLKAMNRHYSVEMYLNQIKEINKKFNLPFIGSDIIVGFPDETNEDFEETYNNIKKSGLTMAHVFPYSIRKDTAAAKMENQIPEEIKHLRLTKLKTLMQEKFEKFVKENIGATQSVIFEKNICKKTGYYKGLTSNYLTVYCPTENQVDVRGKMYNCIILEKQGDKLICKPL